MAGISGAGREELASVLGRGARLVTVEEVSAGLSVSRTAAAKRLARWASLGWLRRVRRGLYIPVPLEVENPAEWTEDALYLADAVWAPCYFTGWTTANHWGLTEQVFRTTMLKTTQRVRCSTGQLAGHDYFLVHAQPEDLTWGLKVEWRHDCRLRLADPARTVIDVLADLSLSGGIRLAAEILESYLLDHPGDVLIEYGDRLGNGALFKRLGYLIEQLGLDQASLVAACRQRLTGGVVLLDPTLSDRGLRISEWGLRLNTSIRFEGAS